MLDPGPVTLARAETPRGSVVLRRRTVDGHEIVELVVNGAFVMDDGDTSTERLVAVSALARARTPRTVVVGGLGLGYTVRELLDDPRVERVEVVELEPVVVDWVRSRRVPGTAGVLDDPRVRMHVADLRYWLPDRPNSSVDTVVLDVDNGPAFLVHRANVEVYEAPFLSHVARVLRPGGVLAVWSASRSNALRNRLERTLGGTCEEIRRTVTREGRRLTYFLYVATIARPPAP